jgi:N-acetyl-anhydromuramyl-L-alanine amidase AmpD
MVLYKKGSRGEMVKQIQKALHLVQDGIYGPITEEAVKAFQKQKGLKVDGIVGPATLALLIPSRFRKSKRMITEIIIHCTATPEGQDATVEQIRADHIKNRGFADIGYHYVVYRNGHVIEGRDVDKIGAHCTNHNAHSIGIAYVGGVENKPGVPYSKQKPKDTRTLAQKAGLLSLLVDLRKLYPDATILGHRDTSPDLNGNGTVEPFEFIKACPCFDAKIEYRKI